MSSPLTSADHGDHAKNADENPDEHGECRTHFFPPLLLFPIVPNQKANDDRCSQCRRNLRGHDHTLREPTLAH